MLDYLKEHPEKIYEPLIGHIQIVLITLALSCLLAAVLTMWAMRSERTAAALNAFFAAVYSVPSLALFALLIPFTGLGMTTAIIVLVVYNQYLLLRNFITGLKEVDPAVVEAARGLGMTDSQVIWKVQVPLAKRALFAGVRLAVVSTIGIGTIAAAINAGGLGSLLFNGLRTMNAAKILWGSILTAGLAVMINWLLSLAEKR